MIIAISEKKIKLISFLTVILYDFVNHNEKAKFLFINFSSLII